MDKMTPISDVVWFQEGPGVRNTQYTTEGVKLLNVANLVDGEVDLSNTNRYISEEEAYGKYKHFLVDEGDLIIASSGIKVDYFDKKMGFIKKEHLPLCMNTSTIRFKTLNADVLDIRYFMYFLKSESFKQQLAVQITGSAQLNFGPSHLKKMSVKMVPMTQQKKIVHNLSEIDRLISYRQQQLIKLDELVKSRFIELLGDPEHNEKQWDVFKLESLCSVGSSKRIYQNELSLDGIPFLRISDLVNRMDTGSTDCELYIPEARYEELNSQGLVPVAGDILLTARGTLGRCYTITESDKFYFQDGMITWLYDFDKSLTTNYLTYLFAMSGFRKQIDSLQAGSTVAYLSISMTKKLDIMLPPIELQNQFATFVEQNDKSKLAVQQSLEKLETLKKALMQKYFG